MDDRFKKVLSDPKFRTLKKKDRKLKIDKRFKPMFEDDKFKLQYARDKRGKANKRHMSEDYKRFYRLSDEEDNVKEEDEEEEALDRKEATKKLVNKRNDEKNEAVDSESDEEEVEEEGQTKIPKVPRGLSHNAGYHRGLPGDNNDDDDGDSSSSSSDSEEDEEEEDLAHEWNELDRDADRGEDISCRVAICNADWDRFNAQDIFVLLNSFKPSTGVIQVVKVFYSKFGEERLKIEETKGPSEFIYGKGECIVPKNEQDEDDEDNDETDDGNDSDKEQDNMERLRKYQLERLKYFFALVICDSAETADAIYKELDGMEYESSATTLDIRFVPNDMEFEDVKLKEECTSLPNSNYKPPEFINTALQQSQVTLTWDETDQKRKQVFEKAFDKDIEDDLKAYLASSSDEEEPNDDEEDSDDNEKSEDKIAKYKKLLNSIDNDEDEVDMQVSWDPTLKDKVFGKKDGDEDMVPKKKGPTKIDEFVDNHSSEDEEDSEANEDDSGAEEDVSEADEDVSEGDEDGNTESEGEELEPSKKSLGKGKFNRKKNKKHQFEETDSIDNEDASKLELLMLNVDNNNTEKKKHFNYKDIVDKYSKNQTVDDNFKFNAEDDRFSAIYNSHLFNVDQSDPNFKRTDAFKQIIDNKKKRGVTQYQPKAGPEKTEPAWKSLAKKVKLNVEEKQSQKNMSKPNKFRVDSKFKR